MIASATKPCQRNTFQRIGQSAGFWILVQGFWFKPGCKFLVSGFDRERPFEAETLNQKLETKN